MNITKLNQLKHVESFLQINFTKGFKYIDKAGEIVNLFFTKPEREPLYIMDQRQLLIRESENSKEEFKIAVNNFWYHKADPENLNDLKNIFFSKAIKITQIVEVDKLTRLGWRNYFIFELSQTNNLFFKKCFEREDKIKLDLLQIVFNRKIKGFECRFEVKKLEKKDRKTPVILFDVDISKKYEGYLNTSILNSELDKLYQLLESEEFIKTINYTLFG